VKKLKSIAYTTQDREIAGWEGGKCPINFSLSCLSRAVRFVSNDKLKFIGHFPPSHPANLGMFKCQSAIIRLTGYPAGGIDLSLAEKIDKGMMTL